ncbi:MAG: heavy metal translocating P-type ATPase [Sulfurospirillum sp.]|nr:heavy metal translocating P-type ATPase [Sulfurospirillum sp.]
MRRCDHCQLEYDASMLICEHDKFFCCKGCQGIYHLLRDEGLEGFYDKLGTNTIQPPSMGGEDVNHFDMDGFLSKYVKQKDGFNEISLIIDGIHCAACVWLNEKVLHKTQGIIEASINHTNNKAKIVYDGEIVKLSQIIQTIRNIGYNAYPYDPSVQEVHANAKRREYYSKLLVGIFTTMNIMWIAIAQYSGYFSGMEKNIKNILNFAEFILATPTLFYTGSVYFKGAYYGLKNHFVNMDILVASGASSAYAFSIYSMFSGHGEVYFDSVTMIVTFVFAGKYLEVLTKKKAVDTLDSFNAALPSELIVIRGDEKVLVPVENIEIDDEIEIKSGDKVVIDGVITRGEGSFDMASLSGESVPVLLKKSDKILSGSVCLDSVIRYKAIKDYKSSVLYKIMSLLEDAMDKKPKLEQLANVISGYFSSTILFLALATFAFWFINYGSFEQALIVCISVIVIACPCALGLATPVATLVGISRAAKKGILFKEATFLETIAKCDTLVLDKTGTITQGKPEVLHTHYFSSFDPSLLYALVSASNHPISKGVKVFLQDEVMQNCEFDTLRVVEAKGVVGEFAAHRYAIGNEVFMQELGVICKQIDGFDGCSLLYFAKDDALVALFGLRDKPRIGAKETIAYLQSLGLEVLMLTGDRKEVALDIATQVGITRVESALLPIEKALHVEVLQNGGKHIVMVGDGINDTLALSKSEVAITLGSGADIALSVSDVVLIGDDFRSLGDVFKISFSTFRVIKQNLAFSILYNIITIPLAMAGFVIPLIAALSMSLSSLVVVGNSMRIR